MSGTNHAAPVRSCRALALATVGLVAVALSAACGGRSSEGSPTARVVLDPMGVVRFDDVEVHFPALELPLPGEYPATANESVVRFGSVPEAGAGFAAASTGKLVVQACSSERVAMVLTRDGLPEVRIDEAPALRPLDAAVVRGGPVETIAAPNDLPAADSEDLFFAALGSAGTGLPGQHRVADALARVAPQGPLDFVLMLGDLFTPRGAQSGTDPVFERCFESVYDAPALDVPFHFCFGDREHLGNIEALAAFESLHRRFSAPALSHTFEVENHGVRLAFVAIDTTSCLGDVRNPLTRRARSAVVQNLSSSDADWKIVFGHHPMYGGGSAEELTEQARLRQQIEPFLRDHGAALYLAGSGRYQAVLEAKGGVTHVVTGAGGGPELAESVTFDDDTLFAATGGGFVTVRFDGEALQVVVRDVDGAPLFAHRVTR